MKKRLIFVLLIAFIVSACSNQNNEIQDNISHSDSKSENFKDTDKVRNSISPEVPEPLPPAKDGITVEPLPPAKKEDRFGVINNTDKYEEEKARAQAVKYHNDNKSSKDIFFPNTIKVGETISKEVAVDDEPGKIAKVDAIVDVEKKEKSHIVKLKINYNTKLNAETIGYWEYEVTKSEVKIIDKKVDDDLRKIIT